MILTGFTYDSLYTKSKQVRQLYMQYKNLVEGVQETQKLEPLQKLDNRLTTLIKLVRAQQFEHENT